MADDQLPGPSKRVTIGGHTFELGGVSAEDPYWLNVQDDYEPEFQAFCRQMVQRDAVCLDIGANIGTKTLFLSRHCPDGRVVALEAGRQVEAVLARNIRMNACSNAVSYHAAASDHDGSLTFAEGSAWGHESNVGAEVEAMTLETLVSRNKLERVDFLKVDVEGGEFPVLKSSLSLINRFETLVYVELNSLTLLVWGNTNPREFLEWIGSNFQHVYAVNRSAPGQPLLSPVVTTDDCRAILHRNLVDDGCVTDLVMSNATHRFGPTREHFEEQMTAVLSQLSIQSVQLAALHAKNADLQNRLLAQSEHEKRVRELALQTEAVELAQKLEELEHGERARSEWIRSLEVELSAVRADAARVEAERLALLTSTSWRIAAPVRWAKKASRRLSRG